MVSDGGLPSVEEGNIFFGFSLRSPERGYIESCLVGWLLGKNCWNWEMKFCVMRDKREMSLNEKLLNLILDGLNLSLQFGSLICCHRARNNGPIHTTSPTKGRPGGNKYVGDILVLAKKREMEENLNWLSVGSHDDEFGDASIEGLCCCNNHRGSDKEFASYHQ